MLHDFRQYQITSHPWGDSPTILTRDCSTCETTDPTCDHEIVIYGKRHFILCIHPYVIAHMSSQEHDIQHILLTEVSRIHYVCWSHIKDRC